MSDDSSNVKYQISADAGPFAAGMERAVTAATTGASQIKRQFDTVGAAFEQVQKQLLVITAVVAGGAFFKEAIAGANKLTGEAMNLSKRLAITGSEAATLNTALGDIGSDSETYIGAFDKFAKQLKANEQGLNDMGIQTRDANGHLRDSRTVFQEALAAVGQYKPGLDQTTASMTLFGKGVDDVMKLQRLNNGVLEDAAAKNEELGMALTKEGVEASKKYKAAMNDVGDVLTAVQNAIGQAVMPVFTELGEYFAKTGPYVVGLFKGALLGLLAVFEVIKAAVKTVSGFIFESINFWLDGVGLFGEVMTKVLSGDFSGAYEAAKNLGRRVAQVYTGAFSNFLEAGNDAEAAVKAHTDRLFGKGTEVGQPKGGKRTMGAFASEGQGSAKGDQDKSPSYMKYYEEALSEERRLAAERDAIHGMSKQAEADFWNNLLANAKLTTSDQVAVLKKASEARIEVLKQEAQRADELGKLDVAAWEARGLAKIAQEEEQARSAQALGATTRAQLLEQEAEFERRKSEIRRAALGANLMALDPMLDATQVAQIHNQLEALEQQHQQRMLQIRGQAAVEQGKVWDNLGGRMASLWDQGMQAMLSGSLTWAGAQRAIGAQLAGWFGQAVVGDMIKKWAAGKAAQLSATLLGIGAEKTAQIAGAAATMGIKVAEADVVISANAAEAASGAAASQASIPWAGPGLAIAAFAAVMAMVMGAKGSIKSASGGYDIPAGVNPVTQLHEQEMVLPAKHADVIRGLADGGPGGVGGGANFNVQLTGTPMRGGFFMLHRDELVAAFNSARRDFAIK